MASLTNNRLERLRAWRQETGRTPMKRLSYVVECASRPHPPALTPSLVSKPAKRPLSSLGAPPKPHPLPSGKRPLSSGRSENCPPVSSMREGAERCGLSTSRQRRKDTTNLDLAQMRRKMLEDWRARNGKYPPPPTLDSRSATHAEKVLKRPPLFLRSVSRTEKPPRMGRRRHTIGGVVGGGGGGGGLVEGGKSERELLKERLQQELAEECAVEMMEGGVEAEEPHATPRGEREDERKEEEESQDSSGSFKSRRVRFMLSEPRRRRSCYAGLTLATTPHTVYITPVRRSTREGRNWDGPGMKLDSKCCFDSPSEVSKQLDFDNLQIITNDMLQ